MLFFDLMLLATAKAINEKAKEPKEAETNCDVERKAFAAPKC